MLAVTRSHLLTFDFEYSVSGALSFFELEHLRSYFGRCLIVFWTEDFSTHFDWQNLLCEQFKPDHALNLVPFELVSAPKIFSCQQTHWL